MTVYAHYSANFEGSIFTHVGAISLNIFTTIIARVPNVSNNTCKYSPITGTVFYLNSLLRHNGPIYYFFNSHLFQVGFFHW